MLLFLQPKSLGMLEIVFEFFSLAAFYDHWIADHGGEECHAHHALNIAWAIFDANQLS